MADLITAAIAFGPGNAGAQIGQSYGTVTNEIHLPPERAETLPRPFSNVPFPSDPDHVSRTSLTEELRSKLVVGGGARVALVGLGGVGKSQLAIEHSHHVRRNSPETWVLWLHASNAARFEQGVRDTVNQLKIAGRKDSQANIFTLFQGWLRDERKGPWLLVLDNADDAAFLREPIAANTSSASRSLYGCVPFCEHGSVLITSRSRDAALQLVDSRDIISVHPMAEQQAITLLERKLGDLAKDEDAKQLAETLEFMPLAITQAAAYIRNRAPRCSVQQYIEKVRRSDKSKSSLLDQDQADLRRDDESRNSIILTWQISFDHISKIRRTAADLLSLMSFFDRESIAVSLLKDPGLPPHADGLVKQLADGGKTERKGRDYDGVNGEEETESPTAADEDDALEDDIAMLCSYSFISINADAEAFKMHRLVQLATRRWLEAQKRLERWKVQCIHNLDTAFPVSDYKSWTVCQFLYPHVRSMLNLKVADHDAIGEWARMLFKAGFYAVHKGAASEAEEMAVLCIAAFQSELGEESEDVLMATHLLAWSYDMMGRWSEEEKLVLHQVEASKRVFGEEHWSTLLSISSLVKTYLGLGRWVEAEKLGTQLIEAQKRALGEEHPAILLSTANLAMTYSYLGRWSEAEKLNLHLLGRMNRALGGDHPDTRKVRRNLAATYMLLGRCKEAEHIQRQEVERMKATFGEEHPDTLISMGQLSVTLWAQGRFSEAEELELRVVEARKKLLGDQHPHTLASMGNLAEFYSQQGRLSEAEKLSAQVLDTRKRMYGEEHPDTLVSMGQSASALWAQGHCSEAEELASRVVEGRKRVLGDEHPHTLTSMNDLAVMYADQGRSSEAEKLCMQVLDARKRVHGEEHRNTLQSLGTLASIYENRGCWDESEVLCVQVLDARKKVLGDEHPETLVAIANLADTYYGQGRHQAALTLMSDCAARSANTLGPAHPVTVYRCGKVEQWTIDQGSSETQADSLRTCTDGTEEIDNSRHQAHRTLAP